MKKLIFCIFLLATTKTFSQTQTQQPHYPVWQHPIFKQIQAKPPILLVYSDTNTFVNIAVVDTKAKLIYWISAIGYVNDICKLSDLTYNRIITKKETPFEYYDRLTKDAIRLYDAAIFKFRFPKLKAYYKGIPEYDKAVTQMMDIPEFKNAKTPLEKLAALYKERQEHIDKLVYSNIVHPNKVKQDTTYAYHLSNITRGKVTVTEHTDSTGFAEFYSKDDRSPIYKAILDIAKAKIYFYHQNQTIFDSLIIKRQKIETLFTEGTDIFTLYRNYSLWKLTTLDSISKLVDNYKAKKYTSPKEKQNTENVLANYGGSVADATTKIREAYKVILYKLDTLLATNLHFLEQELKDQLSKQNPHLQFGEYKNNQLVIYPPAPNNASNGTMHTITRGETLYQLTDHRGNVMAVINDKKIGHDTNGDGIIDYYTAEVVKATDYSSFGAPLPGRTFQIAPYKYGYNGKEEDKETGYTDYGARMYDPNIGRFISPDPMIARMPGVGSYTYVNNNPIRYIDPDGKFLLDVHQRIVQAALGGLSFELITRNRKTEKGGDGLNNDMKNQSFMFGIVGQGTVFSGGITDPDWNQASIKAAHFDQMNYKDIIANVESIKTGASNLVTKYKSGILTEEKFGYEVGKQLHGIADLYSHSNYVELYVQLYGKNNDINSIPTLKEAMADSKYEKFAALLKTDLKRGDYPGKGPGSHKAMNHDVGAGSNYTWLVPETRGKKVTYESKAAEAVATKASKEYLTELKTEIDKK